MNASEIMTRNPGTVASSQSVADAVKIMRDANCGIVPVTAAEDRRTIVGLLTDRDIALKACIDGGAGPTTQVSAVMSEHLFCVHPDDDLVDVRRVMENAGVRRVPVIEEKNRLVGIISMKDLAANLGDTDFGRIDETILSQPPNN